MATYMCTLSVAEVLRIYNKRQQSRALLREEMYLCPFQLVSENQSATPYLIPLLFDTIRKTKGSIVTDQVS